MEHINCVICYTTSSESVIQNKEAEGTSQAEAKNFNSLEFEDNLVLGRHLSVIFVLRTFLGVPVEKCTGFLQDHGDPCSWVHWCDSCSIIVKKAKDLFDKITILQKEFEILQNESKSKVISSSKSLMNSFTAAEGFDPQHPTAVIREWIVEQSTPASKEFPILSTVKIELLDSHQDDSDAHSMFDVKMEVNSDSSEGYVQPKKKAKTPKKKRQRSSRAKMSKPKPVRAEGDPVDDVGSLEDEKRYTCKHCPKKFAHTGSLVIHERVHTGERPYGCKLCDKRFRANSDLRKHEKIHKGDKPFSCETCGKSFYLRPDLRKHERIHTGERNFCCHICGNKFGTAKTLRNHLMIHTGDKPRLCTVCGRRFVNNQQLTRHQRTHTGERPYSCSFCEKRFYDLGGLQKHEMLHRGEKPFVCSTCGFSFTQSSALKSHQRTHVGEKPYKCSFCERTFTQSSTQKIHERTHTGERPFKCNICGKQVITKSSLKIHEKTHSGIKEHCCSICGKLFPQAYSVNRHMRKVHSVTNDSPSKRPPTIIEPLPPSYLTQPQPLFTEETSNFL